MQDGGIDENAIQNIGLYGQYLQLLKAIGLNFVLNLALLGIMGYFIVRHLIFASEWGPRASFSNFKS